MKTVEPEPIALTIRESARRLSVSQMTVRRLLDRGELARVRIGRAVRVTARSVQALAAEGGAHHGS